MTIQRVVIAKKGKTTAEADEVDTNGDGKHSESEIQKQIDALDGVEGKDAAEKRRALYDKLEQKKKEGAALVMAKKALPNKALRSAKERLHDIREKLADLKGKKDDSATKKRAQLNKDLDKAQQEVKRLSKAAGVHAATRRIQMAAKKATTAKFKAIDVAARIKAMANLEVADVEANAEKVLEIIKNRAKVFGAIRMFESQGFNASGTTLITKHTDGDILVFKMILQANGFELIHKSRRMLVFMRNAINEAGNAVRIEVSLIAGIPDLMTIAVRNV